MISENFPPFVGGYAIICGETARLLKERGHEVRVITSIEESGEADDSDVVRVLKCAPVEGYQTLHPGYLLRQLRRHRILMANRHRVEAETLDFRPHVAFVWQFSSIGIGVVQALQRKGIPTVLHVGDQTLCTQFVLLKGDPNPFWRSGRRWLYGVDAGGLDLSHLIVVSRALKDYCGDHGFSESQMTLLHNGIARCHVLDAPRHAGTGKRLLYAGRLHPTKGVDIAIKALTALNGPLETGFTLDLIGTGPPDYVEELKALARALDLHNSLRFVGPVVWEELLNRYEEYDMLLFPSVGVEAFGLTVIEAMARGVPVIASDRGGPKDIITHMVDGLLVEPENPEAFADGIRLLSDRPELRHDMAERAVRKVKDMFTLEENVNRVEQILLRMVGTGGALGQA